MVAAQFGPINTVKLQTRLNKKGNFIPSANRWHATGRPWLSLRHLNYPEDFDGCSMSSVGVTAGPDTGRVFPARLACKQGADGKAGRGRAAVVSQNEVTRARLILLLASPKSRRNTDAYQCNQGLCSGQSMMLCHHEREYHDYERRKEKKYHSWFSSLNQRTTPSHRIGPFKRTDYCTQNAP